MAAVQGWPSLYDATWFRDAAWVSWPMRRAGREGTGSSWSGRGGRGSIGGHEARVSATMVSRSRGPGRVEVERRNTYARLESGLRLLGPDRWATQEGLVRSRVGSCVCAHK
jgi:hypothetical protein